MSRVICVPDHSFEQAGYVMGHLHPRSRLHAKQVMWMVIFIPDHGFEPSMLCDGRFLSPEMALSQQVML
jgi:hypothetical protein